MATHPDDERPEPVREGEDRGAEAVCPVCGAAGTEAGLARHLRHEHGWSADRIDDAVDGSATERGESDEPR